MAQKKAQKRQTSKYSKLHRGIAIALCIAMVATMFLGYIGGIAG